MNDEYTCIAPENANTCSGRCHVCMWGLYEETHREADIAYYDALDSAEGKCLRPTEL